MDAIASQITSLTIVYSIVYSDADQRKHQSSASLAFVQGIHRGPVNSPHKWPVTQKFFSFDDVIMMVCVFHNCDYLCKYREVLAQIYSVVNYINNHNVYWCNNSRISLFLLWTTMAPTNMCKYISSSVTLSFYLRFLVLLWVSVVILSRCGVW